MEIEIWEKVKNYEGIYEISSLGRVKRLWKNGKSRINHPVVYWNKYKVAYLSKNSKRKAISLHRLVAVAFIPNPENKPFINHINGIKTDNRVVNLEWCTPSENTIHAYNVLGFKNKPSKGKFNGKSKKVIDTSTGLIYDCLREVSDIFAINYSTLINQLSGHKRNNTNFIYLKI